MLVISWNPVQYFRNFHIASLPVLPRKQCSVSEIP
jgi:hypothetical protein